MNKQRVSNEQVVEAYRRFGNVWSAAKSLGIAGQSLWERLRAIGHPMHRRHWTAAELEELKALAGNCTIGEIASRLGRPYYGVALKLSRLGLGVRFGNRRPVKLPRGAGYDKVTTKNRAKLLLAYPGSLRQFCRANSLAIEQFVHAVQRHCASDWREYTRRHSDLGEGKCPNCDATFYPLNKKQKTCSRRCSAAKRADETYFGGNRRNTIGLAEGRCQLCGREKDKGLSSHHVIGKENDPDNELLIALCAGCHHVVSLLSRMKLIETERGWEDLIHLCAARHLPEHPGKSGTHVTVDIEWLTEEELVDDCADESPDPVGDAARSAVRAVDEVLG